MGLDVKVKIDISKVPGKAGFGVPLIFAGKGTAVDYKECNSLAEISTAGFASTTEVYKTAELLFMQDDAPKTVAVCSTTDNVKTWLSDPDNVAKGWRQLIVTSLGTEGESTIAEIISTVETLDGKMFFASLDVDDTTSITKSGIKRSVLFYCTDANDTPYNNPVAALVGATAGKAAGSINYKNTILKGITPQNLTDSEITAIHAKGGITFVTKAGDNVTSEGKTAGGEYIDIVDSEDYIILQLGYQTQKLLNSVPKVPYDNNGIALLESIAVNVMKDAYNKGIIATNEDGTPAYFVNYAMRENTSETDRAERKYLGGQFSFKLAGAINEVEITGEIII